MREKRLKTNISVILVTGCLFLLRSSASEIFTKLPCSAPLGLRQGHSDPTLTFDLWASSGDASSARLNSETAWTPRRDEKHFLLIKTSRPVVLTAIQTQGSPNSPDLASAWVLETSIDCENYRSQIYTSGTKISNDTFVTDLKNPEFASCIRIWPTSYFGRNSALRLELLGCVISESSSGGCWKDNEYDVHPVQNGREIFFWQERVVAWLKVRVPQSKSSDPGTVFVFYSRSCNGEDWAYLDTSEMDTAWEPSYDESSIWIQHVLDTPVRAKCMRVISDTSSSVQEVLTNECNASPLSRIHEISDSSKSGTEARDQSLGPEYNETLSLEKQVSGIFDEDSDGNEGVSEQNNSINTSASKPEKETTGGSNSEHFSFGDPLMEIMFLKQLEGKSPISDSYEQTLDIGEDFDVQNTYENISDLFRDSDSTWPIEEFNLETISNEQNFSEPGLLATHVSEEKPSIKESSPQKEAKTFQQDSSLRGSPQSSAASHSSLSSSQELRSIAQNQPDFDTSPQQYVDLQQSDASTAPVEYKQVPNSRDREIKPYQEMKRTRDSSSEKKWTKKHVKMSLKKSRSERRNKSMSQFEKKQGCGIKHHRENSRWKRVVAGEPNTLGQWPWLVSLHYLPFISFTNDSGYKHLCGGSLISPDWIVTAAHCFENGIYNGLENLTSWEVKVGINDLAGEEDTPGSRQDRLIEAVHKHPDYNTLVSHYESDIALLKLNKPVHFSDIVSTVCLRDTFEDVEQHCLVSGWGQLTAESPGSRFAHTASIKTMTLRECNATFDGLKDDHPAKDFFNRINEKILCTAIGSNGEDACQGDSGSPLMCEHEGRWYLTGLVSAGYECGNPSVPAICTRVSHFVDWIEATTKLTLQVKEDSEDPDDESDSVSDSEKSGARSHF